MHQLQLASATPSCFIAKYGYLISIDIISINEPEIIYITFSLFWFDLACLFNGITFYGIFIAIHLFTVEYLIAIMIAFFLLAFVFNPFFGDIYDIDNYYIIQAFLQVHFLK